MNHVSHLLSSAKISIISLEISEFCYMNKYRYRFHFGTLVLIILTFFNKHGYNFDDVSKIGYPRPS